MRDLDVPRESDAEREEYRMDFRSLAGTLFRGGDLVDLQPYRDLRRTRNLDVRGVGHDWGQFTIDG